MFKVTILIDNADEADPSEVLEAAQAFAEDIAAQVGGTADENDVCVEEVD